MFRARLCPSSGAQDLYRWLLPVILGALVYRSLVWCGAVGYVSGLQDATAEGYVSGLQDATAEGYVSDLQDATQVYYIFRGAGVEFHVLYSFGFVRYSP